MWNAWLDESQGGIKIARRNINNLVYASDINGRKWRVTKELLGESERGDFKSWLKGQHSKNKDCGIQSHYFMANWWGNNGNSERILCVCVPLGSKSLRTVTAIMKLKDACSLEVKHWQTYNQRCRFANRGLSSQTCGFSSSHVQM